MGSVPGLVVSPEPSCVVVSPLVSAEVSFEVSETPLPLSVAVVSDAVPVSLPEPALVEESPQAANRAARGRQRRRRVVERM
jgi:hypothetical protein